MSGVCAGCGRHYLEVPLDDPGGCVPPPKKPARGEFEDQARRLARRWFAELGLFDLDADRAFDEPARHGPHELADAKREIACLLHGDLGLDPRRVAALLDYDPGYVRSLVSGSRAFRRLPRQEPE